ncbi:MAG TPA: hypothetical protein VF590_21410 [Isosphaeraceae bacterium]|jgi:hypothetical protein
MSQVPMPAYVNRVGRQVLRPPILCQNVALHGFMFAADANVLQDLCDTYLNRPSGGRLRFVPLVPRVVTLWARTGRLQSADPRDRDLGWMTEIDVAFWVPVAEVDPAGGSSRPRRLAWFQPFIFVDSVAALDTGREVYGYPKQLGQFTLPQGVADADLFAVDTQVWEHPGPDCPLQMGRLFEIRRTGGAPAGAGLAETWDDLEGAFRALARLFFGAGGKLSLASVELLIDVFEYLHSGAVESVFLKQFRDCADADYACYQAIVSAAAKVTGFRTAGALAGDYQLTVFPCGSEPIAAALGLGTGSQPALAAWYVDFDFQLEAGQVEEIGRPA